MTEVTITRTKPIVVNEIGQNEYGDLTFTDKEGNSYKVKAKRKQHFDGIIVPDAAVQLNYAVYMKTEYVYSAVSVKDKLPPAVKVETVVVPGVEIPHDTRTSKPPAPPPPKPLPPAPVVDMIKVRSMSLSYAHDLVQATLIQGKPITAASIALVVKIAYLFERYICGDLVISDEVTAETITMLTKKAKVEEG